ncbi:MAG: hypothetical protein J4G11_06305 [Acidimicrobiia bacterium]|nr:hypothetical protein [Acidimicrobiia bacterium]
MMRSRGGGAGVPKPRRRITNLDRAAVGRSITRLGISLFPGYLPGNDLEEIATGPTSGLAIEELRASTVPSLEVTNPTNRPVLIPEGSNSSAASRIGCTTRASWLLRPPTWTYPRLASSRQVG